LVQAQSIIINHQFQGTTVFDLSFGGGKIGWVTYDSSLANPYTYHYMNNLQNTISVNDTTLTDLAQPSFTFPYVTGDNLLTAKMDANGHLWGLFYDFSRAAMLNNLGFSSMDTNNFFLYDFDNHQRHYLEIENPDALLLNGINSGYEMTYKNDTLLINFFCSRYNGFNFEPSNYCVKWVNGTVISEGSLSNFIQGVADVFIDHNNRQNILYNGTPQLWEQSEGNYIGAPYQQTIAQPVGFYPYIFDVILHNGSIYCLGQDSITLNHKILIRNNTGDVTINTNITCGGPSWMFNKILVDHDNRIWIYRLDSVFVYDGNWNGFTLSGATIANQMPNGAEVKNTRFIEYVDNKFAVSFSNQEIFNELPNGNGILFFDYLTTSTNNQSQIKAPQSIKIYPNPAQFNLYFSGGNSANQTASIYNAVGKLILRSLVNHNQSIDVSALNKGIYFVEMAGQRIKFVKE
jgi:hypothetical protein